MGSFNMYLNICRCISIYIYIYLPIYLCEESESGGVWVRISLTEWRHPDGSTARQRHVPQLGNVGVDHL